MPLWILVLASVLAQEVPAEIDAPADPSAEPASHEPTESSGETTEEADEPTEPRGDEPAEPTGPRDNTGLLGLDGLPDDGGGDDEVSEADVINSFISFAKVERDDTKTRPVVGVHAGVGIPTVRLGPSPQLRGTFGVRFPQAGGRIMPWLSLTGTTAALRDTGAQPYDFEYSVRHSQAQLGLGSSVRIFHYREKLSPEFGLAPQLHVMTTSVGASVAGGDGGQVGEVLVRPGWTALAGVVLRPGKVVDWVVDLSIDGAPVRSELSGDVAEYSINLRIGTRFTLRPKPSETP